MQMISAVAQAQFDRRRFAAAEIRTEDFVGITDGFQFDSTASKS
jgi:hypothetical protein